MAIREEEIKKALSNVMDPDLNKDIVSLGFVKNIKIDETKGKISLDLELTTPACPFKTKMKEEAEKNLLKIEGVKEVDIKLTSKVRSSHKTKNILQGIKNIIPVASGKGGVGKSTVSVNLALALSQLGAEVGLMDADIYGPTIPTLLGLSKTEIRGTEEKIFPIQKYGIKVMSMGFFLAKEQPVIWRGPMLDKMVTQFLNGVDWEELDYLVVDLPPGTGDVQLSLCQKVDITGAVIVSTPQDVALNIAQKAIGLFQKLNAPILGIIENMSYYICTNCGKKEYIFGESGVQEIAKILNIPLLGTIPLSPNIRIGSDKGEPIVIVEPECEQSKCFIKIAENLASQISIKNIKN